MPWSTFTYCCVILYIVLRCFATFYCISKTSASFPDQKAPVFCYSSYCLLVSKLPACKHHSIARPFASYSIRKKKLRGHAARLRAYAAVRGVRVNVIRRTCCVHTCGLILAVSTQSETLERNSAIHHAPPRIHPHANVKHCVGT